MQNMIKEIPLQYLTPKQFKRWTASVGFSGAAADQFNEDELGDSADELFQKEYHWGKEDISKVEIEIEGSEPVRLDSIVGYKLALETRRALHKTPAFQEDSEYMVLLSEHWDTRLDENILTSEFQVRKGRASQKCACLHPCTRSQIGFHTIAPRAWRLRYRGSRCSVSPCLVLRARGGEGRSRERLPAWLNQPL